MSRPSWTRSIRVAKSLAARVGEPDRLAARADVNGRRPLARAAASTRLATSRVGVDHRARAGAAAVREQPQLGVEIVLERRVIVEMIARQIGEGGGGQAHAVEPLLVEPVRGGLHRQMRDAGVGERCERSGAARSGPASSASRRSLTGRETTPSVPSEAASIAEPAPDLAREGGDRGLAAGAGDGGDGRGLARIEARGGAREREARVVDAHERRTSETSGARSPTTDAAPLASASRGMSEAVVLRAREREEDVARLDLAAVRRKAPRSRRSGERGVRGAEIENFGEPPHSLPTLSAS